MSDYTYIISAIAVIAAVTLFTRALPFILFPGGKKRPAYIVYLGKVLPYAIMGMLVVYCLKNVSVISAPHGTPELISILLLSVLYVWKRNTLLSIFAGTVCYMLLVQFIFI